MNWIELNWWFLIERHFPQNEFKRNNHGTNTEKRMRSLWNPSVKRAKVNVGSSWGRTTNVRDNAVSEWRVMETEEVLSSSLD
jgi:hypothetical protein